MAVTKKQKRPSISDPAVSAHFVDLGDALTTSTRRRMRQKAIDQERKDRRVFWDVDPEIKAEIERIAEAIGTSQSQVASYLIVAGLYAVERGIIPPPDRAAERTNSMRFTHVLKIPPIPKRAKNNDTIQ